MKKKIVFGSTLMVILMSLPCVSAIDNDVEEIFQEIDAGIPPVPAKTIIIGIISDMRNYNSPSTRLYVDSIFTISFTDVYSFFPTVHIFEEHSYTFGVFSGLNTNNFICGIIEHAA